MSSLYTRAAATVRGQVHGHKALETLIACEKISKAAQKASLRAQADALAALETYVRTLSDGALRDMLMQSITVEHNWISTQTHYLSTVKLRRQAYMDILSEEKRIEPALKARKKAEILVQRAMADMGKAKRRENSGYSNSSSSGGGGGGGGVDQNIPHGKNSGGSGNGGSGSGKSSTGSGAANAMAAAEAKMSKAIESRGMAVIEEERQRLALRQFRTTTLRAAVLDCAQSRNRLHLHGRTASAAQKKLGMLIPEMVADDATDFSERAQTVQLAEGIVEHALTIMSGQEVDFMSTMSDIGMGSSSNDCGSSSNGTVGVSDVSGRGYGVSSDTSSSWPTTTFKSYPSGSSEEEGEEVVEATAANSPPHRKAPVPRPRDRQSIGYARKSSNATKLTGVTKVAAARVFATGTTSHHGLESSTSSGGNSGLASEVQDQDQHKHIYSTPAPSLLAAVRNLKSVPN
eukprot:UC1_evm1s1897